MSKKKLYPNGVGMSYFMANQKSKKKYGRGVASAITGKETPKYEPPVRRYAAGLMTALGAAGSMGGSSVLGGVTQGANLLGDVAGLWAATQDDSKAAKMAATFKNVASTTGTINNEIQNKVGKAPESMVNIPMKKEDGPMINPNPETTGDPEKDKYNLTSDQFYAKYGYYPGQALARKGMRVTKSYKKK